MPVNSKAKGGAFERLVCKKLSLWLTDGADERVCWRSSSSGGTATVLARRKAKTSFTRKQFGDITQVSDRGRYPKADSFFDQYTVECKHYKSLGFQPPIDQNLRSFFDQVLVAREVTGKNFLLIVKTNNRPVLWIEQQPDPTCVLQTIWHKGTAFNIHLFDEVIKTAAVTGRGKPAAPGKDPAPAPSEPWLDKIGGAIAAKRKFDL